MFLQRKFMFIALPAFAGALFLSFMLLGAQGPFDGPAFSRAVTAKDPRDHQPLRDVGPVNPPPPVQHHGSAAAQEKSNPAIRPSGGPDRKVSAANQAETARYIEALPPHYPADVNNRSTTGEEASPKAHRSGLYAVLLFLLAGERH